MKNAKATNVPLGGHVKLSSDQCPITKVDKEDMLFVFFLLMLWVIFNDLY